MLEMIEVESSNVKSIGWLDNNLYVEYKSGTKYLYENVDKDIYLKLLGSKSRGQFMNEQIKNKYSYKKI